MAPVVSSVGCTSTLAPGSAGVLVAGTNREEYAVGKRSSDNAGRQGIASSAVPCVAFLYIYGCAAAELGGDGPTHQDLFRAVISDLKCQLPRTGVVPSAWYQARNSILPSWSSVKYSPSALLRLVVM